jgi:hypothetical protein
MIVIARKPVVPCRHLGHDETSHWQNPDWVNAQAIAVAVPMICMTAPVSEIVSTRIGYIRHQSNWR